jgi:tyrosine-protein kinase Etk/Wzc
VIDKALPMAVQISPKPVRIYGFALIVGLFLPIILIYILDLLNDKVTTRTDITKATSAPIVGEIGHNDEDSMLIFPGNSRTVIAEQFRIIRSNINFLLADSSKKATFMVTSSFSGEGKSFVSTNLGAALALSGKKTVILEFDLRKPKILAGLNLAKGQGLTNFLVGGAILEELPQEVKEIENLYVIGSGPVPPNPSEILLTHRVDDLFNWLKKNFDAIVIDTAPVGRTGWTGERW